MMALTLADHREGSVAASCPGGDLYLKKRTTQQDKKPERFRTHNSF